MAAAARIFNRQRDIAAMEADVDKQEITGYQLVWHPGRNQGQIAIEVAGQRMRVPIESAEEFAAVPQVLARSPVYFYADGAIATEREAVIP
jgi:hypothetical protein